jgi:hypothetical protein
MGRNDYLARQKIMQQTFFDAGLQIGRQQILDMMSLTLNDTFFQRYEFAAEYDYTKGKWK